MPIIIVCYRCPSLSCKLSMFFDSYTITITKYNLSIPLVCILNINYENNFFKLTIARHFNKGALQCMYSYWHLNLNKQMFFLLLYFRPSFNLIVLQCCCCCLPCNNCSNWAWVVEEHLANGNRLRSTHCRELNYVKLCRP